MTGAGPGAGDGAVLLIEVEGSRFEIGAAHGEQARDLVRGTLDWSFNELGAAGLARDEALARAVRLVEIVRTHTPELVDEIDGIAAGAGLAAAEAAVINTRYELLFIGNSAGYLAHRARGECTIFGVEGCRTEHGGPIVGQNVDLDAGSRPYWIMLSVRPEGGPRVLTVTLAGMLAQEGLNSAGLALCGSMVRCGGWRAGYPSRKFLRRRVLEQRSVAEAIAAVRSSPARASSHNLMLADLSGALADIETTIEDVNVLAPEDGFLAHSNHYVASCAGDENRHLGDYLANSETRLDRMRKLLREAPSPFTAAAAKRLLQDHFGGGRAICRHGDRDEFGSETNIAVVVEPALRKLHVAFGPPCQAAFTTYELEERGVRRWPAEIAPAKEQTRAEV